MKLEQKFSSIKVKVFEKADQRITQEKVNKNIQEYRVTSKFLNFGGLDGIRCAWNT